jgi:plasmid stabilization system protein ParE
MVYKLITTDKMEELLDEKIYYLLNVFKSEQAAKHLLNSIDEIYNNLEINPYIYRESQDFYLRSLHYHEAILSNMEYILIYRIEGKTVYILGIFNSRENYPEKMKIINMAE